MALETGLIILGSTIGGAKLVEKVLGPRADYVGIGLQNWAEKRVKNERHETLRFSHWGSVEHVNPLNAARGWCEVNEYGLCVAPTQFGIDYWLWAIGVGQTSITKFLQDDLTLPRLPEIELSDGPIKLISGEQ
jgi:hypothetical protein